MYQIITTASLAILSLLPSAIAVPSTPSTLDKHSGVSSRSIRDILPPVLPYPVFIPPYYPRAAYSADNVTVNPFGNTSVPNFSFPDPNLAPLQTAKNCHGSIICGWTGSSCKWAAQQYRDDLVYKNFTAYVAQDPDRVTALEQCTAVFECEEGEYGEGWTGLQIKAAFARLWTPEPGWGKHCKRCGSAYMGKCKVSANYCDHCVTRNTYLAQPSNTTSTTNGTAPLVSGLSSA